MLLWTVSPPVALSYLAGVSKYGPSEHKVVVMPVVAVVPAVVAAAAPFPVIAVDPVAGVVVASLHSILNAEAASIRI